MRVLAVLALALTAGCYAEIETGQLPDGGTPPAKGNKGSDLAMAPGPGPGPGAADLALSGPCPPGQHLEGMVCVSDELTCANEFPCPDGYECKGGRCIQKAGPCQKNDDCPVGDVCVNGICVPYCPGKNPECKVDADCGAGKLCVKCACVSIGDCAKPTADISGPTWQAHQVLHLKEALGAFGGVMAGILKKLRDGILGCPPGSSNDCFLFKIIASFLPQWSKTLIVALGNFADVLDNDQFIVDSEMTFKKNGKPTGYDGVDDWKMLSFRYQNMQVMKKPQDVPQIGKPVIVPFQSSAVCGILYVDKHKVEGVLSGILRWIVDTVVEIQTKGQYKSLSAAISGAINCNAIPDLAAKTACFAFTKGLANKIDDALDKWLLDYSLMTLKGTAKIDPGGKLLFDGHWDGTLGSLGGIFKNFTGEWEAMR